MFQIEVLVIQIFTCELPCAVETKLRILRIPISIILFLNLNF